MILIVNVSDHACPCTYVHVYILTLEKHVLYSTCGEHCLIAPYSVTYSTSEISCLIYSSVESVMIYVACTVKHLSLADRFITGELSSPTDFSSLPWPVRVFESDTCVVELTVVSTRATFS